MNSIAGRLHNVKYSISESKTKKQQRLRLRRPRTASLFSIAEIEIDGSVVPLLGRSIKHSIPAWIRRVTTVDQLEAFLNNRFGKHYGSFEEEFYLEASDYLGRPDREALDEFCGRVNAEWYVVGTVANYPTRGVGIIITPKSEARKLPLSFNALTKLEPKLAGLLAETKHIASTAKSNPVFCANAVWLNTLKPRIKELVGWHCDSEDSRLRSTHAFDVVSDKLYDLLPDCRGCNCM